ncbi:hypothetical protein Tco_1549858 [Tanacetum coccineum]
MIGRPGVFVGYPHGTKGYKIFDPSHNKIIVSRDVKFAENAFPFGTNVEENIGENNDEKPYDVGEEQVETSHEPTDEEWSNHDVPDPSNDEDRQTMKETNDDTEIKDLRHIKVKMLMAGVLMWTRAETKQTSKDPSTWKIMRSSSLRL